jgi:hypothetical protein
MEAEFVDGDRATRLKVFAFVGVVILLILLDQLTFPGAALRATDPMQALKKSVDRLLIPALTSVPFGVVISIYCTRLAIKIKRSGRWPPPGMRVPIRIQVVRGRRAKWNAILLLFLAVVIILPAPVLMYAWYSISRVATDLSHLNKQMQPAPRSGRG